MAFSVLEMAKLGDKTARAALIRAYVKRKRINDFPADALECIESYFLDIADDIEHGDNITAKFFPENPTGRPSEMFNAMQIYDQYRILRMNGESITDAYTELTIEYDLDYRTIQRTVKKAEKHYKTLNIGDNKPPT